MSANHHLAQVNIARLAVSADAPILQDFLGRLAEINALADADPGLVWRYKSDDPKQATADPTDPDLLVNLSVWRDVDSLFSYVYKSAHREPMTRRRDWFLPPEGPYLALWWVPAGHQPSVAEALARLQCLAEQGPGPQAFNFKQRFDAEGREVIKARADAPA